MLFPSLRNRGGFFSDYYLGTVFGRATGRRKSLVTKEIDAAYRTLLRLHELHELGRAILVGPSRKSFIGKVLGLPPEERVEGTAATVAASILNGAAIVRVHDVLPMVRVARMADAILGRWTPVEEK